MPPEQAWSPVATSFFHRASSSLSSAPSSPEQQQRQQQQQQHGRFPESPQTPQHQRNRSLPQDAFSSPTSPPKLPSPMTMSLYRLGIGSPSPLSPLRRQFSSSLSARNSPSSVLVKDGSVDADDELTDLTGEQGLEAAEVEDDDDDLTQDSKDVLVDRLTDLLHRVSGEPLHGDNISALHAVVDDMEMVLGDKEPRKPTRPKTASVSSPILQLASPLPVVRSNAAPKTTRQDLVLREAPTTPTKQQSPQPQFSPFPSAAELASMTLEEFKAWKQRQLDQRLKAPPKFDVPVESVPWAAPEVPNDPTEVTDNFTSEVEQPSPQTHFMHLPSASELDAMSIEEIEALERRFEKWRLKRGHSLDDPVDLPVRTKQQSPQHQSSPLPNLEDLDALTPAEFGALEKRILDWRLTIRRPKIDSPAAAVPRIIPQVPDEDPTEVADALVVEAEKLCAELNTVVKNLQDRREESDHLHAMLIDRAESAAKRILELEDHVYNLDEEVVSQRSELEHLRLQLRAVEVLCYEYVPPDADRDLLQSIENWKSDYSRLKRKMADRNRERNPLSAAASPSVLSPSTSVLMERAKFY